jgi:hypothetical protein
MTFVENLFDRFFGTPERRAKTFRIFWFISYAMFVFGLLMIILFWNGSP